MKVTLLHNTPLWVASTAIRKCWASEGKSDTEMTEYIVQEIDNQDNQDYQYLTEYSTGPKDKALIERIGNKFKHASTLEHLVMTWELTGIISLADKEVIKTFRQDNFSIVTKSDTEYVITTNVRALQQLKLSLEYLNVFLPESYKYLFDLSEH